MSDGSDAFSKAYAQLNTAQRKAVDTIEGPVMVIAGPGTGKTQILTLRIARILAETDARPEHILALTFTESGARAMRERLRTYIGAAAYRVPIHTFHGFAESLIRAYPESYDRVIGAQAVGEVEKIELIESILAGETFTHIRPLGDPSYYVRAIIRAISTMKQEYITPDRCAEIIAGQETELAATPRVHEKGAHTGKIRSEYQKLERSIEKNRELLHVYRAYEALLSERRRYDFEDMLVETIRSLETSEDMLRDLQETYQYVLADEHQDVNGSQNRILALLTNYHASPNLFVVGDEKQAIYRFQGASLENFLYFEEEYADTETIALTENYRSGQEILDAAHSLIFDEEGPQRELRVPLSAHTDEAAEVSRRAFAHEAVEDDWVVSEIVALSERGIPLEEIAVIVRTNREVEAFAHRIRQAGLAVAASADSDILTHPITTSVDALMRAVSEGDDEEALFRVFQAPYVDIPAGDVLRVLAARSRSQPLSALLSDTSALAAHGVSAPERCASVYSFITSARAKMVYTPPHRVLEYLLTESGLHSHVMREDPREGARVLRRLYDEVEELTRRGEVHTLADVVRAFALRVQHNVPLNAPYIHSQQHAVEVLTAHKSKGLEFGYVFVPHLVDRVWGGGRRRDLFTIPLTRHLDSDDFDAADDERRLLYVAMTRAQYGLSLSYAHTGADGKERTPSRLFTYIDDDLITECSTEEAEAAFSPGDALAHVPEVAPVEEAFLTHVLSERGLSATGLNNYLRSPWNYFYRNVLRIPEVQPLHMLFGTVLHNVMEYVTRTVTREGAPPSEQELKGALERELDQLPITDEDFAYLHEKGFTALCAYVPHVVPRLGASTREEYHLRVVLETGDPQIPEVPLTGVLDRLDLDADGTLLRVVDYKSGKPKTRGYIEGRTKDSPGDYKRQLVFYALLLSLYNDERLTTDTFVLSFIEPDSKGEIREEPYTITRAEIDELRETIVRVAKEISTGAFCAEPCDPAVSGYCDLVAALKEKAGGA